MSSGTSIYPTSKEQVVIFPGYVGAILKHLSGLQQVVSLNQTTEENDMKYLRAVASIIATLLVYLGLPLLGWGINDLPSFFSSCPRLGYAMLLMFLVLAVGYQAINAPEGFRGSRGDKSKRLHRQSIVAAVLIFILFGALFFRIDAQTHNSLSRCYLW